MDAPYNMQLYTENKREKNSFRKVTHFHLFSLIRLEFERQQREELEKLESKR